MGASSSRAVASWEEGGGSRWCRCFDEPRQYGVSYGRTGSIDSAIGRSGGEGSASSRGRRRRRRHRSASVSSVESIDEALDRRGRTRERRGSAPKWEVVLEVRRPDGNYTRLPAIILSAVRRIARCSTQPVAACFALFAPHRAPVAVHATLSCLRCMRSGSRRVIRTLLVALPAAPPPSTHTFAQPLVNTALSA